MMDVIYVFLFCFLFNGILANPLIEEIQKATMRIGTQIASNEYFSLQPSFQDAESSSGCMECVSKSSECFLHDMDDHLKRYCANTKCSYVKKLCTDAEKHADFTQGAIIATGHPFSLGYSYCLGAKKCSGKGPADIEIAAVTSIVYEALSSIKTNVNQGMLADSIDSNAVDSCKECIVDGSINMIYYYYEDAKNMCLKYSSKCPKAKWVCEHFFKNKDRALGMIFAHFNAMGEGVAYCFGDRSCHRGDRLTYYDEFFQRYDERKRPQEIDVLDSNNNISHGLGIENVEIINLTETLPDIMFTGSMKEKLLGELKVILELISR